MDTKGQIMHYPQKPLVQSRVSKYLFNNELPTGINAIVAIGCYSGYNQEDSILFNKGAVERGLFRTAKFRTYSDREEIIDVSKQREHFTIPDPSVTKNMKSANYSKIKENGLIEVEKILNVTSRLIINRSALKTNSQNIEKIIKKFKKK